MLFRAAEPTELEDIAEIHHLAFDTEAEARLVLALAQDDSYVPELSIVALEGGDIVGHALLSRIWIDSESGTTEMLSLAPVSIVPEYQGHGIGSILVTVALQTARARGECAVVVLGYADYYARFGFTQARPRGIAPPLGWDVPDEAWMALELEPGALDGVKGVARYPEPFLEVVE